MGRKWSAKWIRPEPEDRFHPVFQKRFEAVGKIKKAKLFITGVGLFETYINGEKISNEFLTPYLNDYQSGVQYFEYDVTELLCQTQRSSAERENIIEVYLGNGWYKGRFSMISGDNLYGDHFALIAELEIETETNKLLRIATDESWTYKGSDVEESGIYDGEIFNRLLWDGKDNPEKAAVAAEEKIVLLERYSLPVIIKETLPVKEVIQTPAGETVLDFGQNFAGFVGFESKMNKGEQVHLEFGEVLQQDNFYNDNYRSAKGGFRYVSDGRTEAVRPHFTYFAGRYVKLSGDLSHLDLNSFKGCVIYSDMERTGYLETSNEKLNRVFENALWSQKCNFIDIPTDCPQRDERLAWTGDINVFAGTACYNMYAKEFLMKFLRDLRAEQKRRNGAVPGFIPAIGPFLVSSVWGDAATFIPWTLYQMYGDTKILEENYLLMKDWVDFIDREDALRGDRHYLYDFGFHFGDWLAMDGSTENSMKGGTEDFFIASAYYYESTRILAETANILGKKEDETVYVERAKKIRTAFLKEYYTATGRLSIDTQAAYVVALRFGLYSDKKRVTKAFRNRLKKDCYQIRCGFVGATSLCRVLGENGMTDLAYRFLLNEDYPGWINEVNLGATTIWERWNTVLSDGTINPSNMNSCNHYAYGSVVEFLYAVSAGIKPVKPGFKEIELAPLPDRRLGKLKCRYKSASGEIVSEWSVEKNGELKYHFEIPKGVKANLKLPYHPENGEKILTDGHYNYSYMPEKDFVHRFAKDSIVKEIAADPEAMEIVGKISKPLFFMLKGADKEMASETLASIALNPFAPVSEKDVQMILEQLYQLS